MSGTRIARRFIVHGDVQGVGFRFFTVRAAEGLAVDGYVKNLDDGTVEVLAEGDPREIDRFLERVRQGPRAGYVERVDVTDLPATGRHTGFRIAY